ncbi:MAG TPA: bifunctional pyr operon transcriptional regulator/uracil phosphoribosyltransferase PyrR [Candidatus Marinimicrobia bacterium]|nr:bifunctional pyr operon transcriptional regulator/uracil phosphoribosyltransferase PyrR [Candidatus Neomarinimicrobiota bacterium]
MNFKVKTLLMDELGLRRTVTRLAHEILERCKGTENVRIIGIRTRGEFLAKRIAKKIGEVEGVQVQVGVLDTGMYRDDFRIKNKLPSVEVTEIPFDVDNKILILVDDVVYTGRTIRAAMDALMDFGRPSAIQLAVLIDRGHRELPIKADYIGRNVPTARNEEVRVHMKEIDGVDEILLVEVDE